MKSKSPKHYIDKSRLTCSLLFLPALFVIFGGWYFTKPEALTEDMTAKILACWEAAAYWDTQETLVSHEPQEGQLTMEQAISTGSTWICKMVEKGLLPSGLAENHFQNISASLRRKRTDCIKYGNIPRKENCMRQSDGFWLPTMSRKIRLVVIR